MSISHFFIKQKLVQVACKNISNVINSSLNELIEYHASKIAEHFHYIREQSSYALYSKGYVKNNDRNLPLYEIVGSYMFWSSFFGMHSRISSLIWRIEYSSTNKCSREHALMIFFIDILVVNKLAISISRHLIQSSLVLSIDTATSVPKNDINVWIFVNCVKSNKIIQC